MAHFKISVPLNFTTKDGAEKTSYRTVGTLFENHRRDTGEIFYSIRLDFPVGVTEMVAFPPKAKTDDGEAH